MIEIQIIWLVIGLALTGIISYLIGVRRGFKTTDKNEYDRGWIDAENNYREKEIREIDQLLENLESEDRERRRKAKMNGLVEQLDELFDDDDGEGYTYGSMYFPGKDETENNNGIDCGYY